jgi:transcription-repair coupling factor (superfamily II helicase)
MQLTGLLELLDRLPAFRHLLENGSETPLALLQSARPYITAGLRARSGNAVILLTARSEMVQQIVSQLEMWLPGSAEGGPPILTFAEADALPYERIAWSSATRQQRLTALSALQSRSSVAPIVVASARALMQKTLPSRELRLALRPVKVGEIVRLDQMAARWVQTGYNPSDVVEEPGVFARRGGIVDIWPPNLPHPVRIDLFGEEVESLRLFDPATQRTLRQVQQVEIGPGSEALSKYGPAALQRLGLQPDLLNAASNLDASAAGSPLQDPKLLLAVREELRQEVDHLRESQSFHGIEWYLPYLRTASCSWMTQLTSLPRYTS